MAFVSSMILRSMRLIGEKARGATLDSSEQAECLAEFNTFLDSLPNERLLAYSIQQDSHTLTSGVSSYTVGVNGDIAVTRPVKIVDPCYVRNSDSSDFPVRVVDHVTWGRIFDKTAPADMPSMLYYDAGFSSTSTATINLWPAPSGADTLFFASWKQIGTVANLSTNLLLPPGYQLFLESNFAIHLAAGQADVSPALLKMAKESKAAIKGVNVPAPVASMDALPVGSRGDGSVTGLSYYVNDYVE
jgi:hypothetical protein